MSRLWTGGGETGHGQSEGLGVTASATVDAAVKRTGTYSFKATAVNSYHARLFTGVLGRTYYFRGYYQVPTNPTGLHRPLAFLSGGTSVVFLELNNTGRFLRLTNSAGTVIATGTTALTAGAWYLIEVSVNIPAAGDSTVALRIDGTVEIAPITYSIGNVALSAVRFGCTSGNIGGLAAIYWDDCALNDDQGADQNSWAGPGKILLLVPVADPGTGTNQGNWTKPGGGATNRHTSVDNAPPIFQADSTIAGDAEKFLRNPTNAAAQLELDVTDYATAGVPAGDVITLVHPKVNTGSGSATDTAGDFGVLSNPVGAQKAMTTFDNTVASTTATTWPCFFADPVYNPTVVRSTRPRLRLSRNSANRTVMANMLGLIVEYAPPPPAVTYYGVSSLGVSFDAVVDGKRETFGRLDFPISFLKEVQAQRTALGQLDFPLIFSKDVNGQRKTFGQLLSPFIFGKTVSGQRKTFGQIALPLSIAIVTSGFKPGITLYGAVSLPMTFGKDVRGQRKAFGQIAMPLTFTKDVRGQRKTFGQIALPIIFTKEAVGRKNVFGQLSMQTLFGKEVAGWRKTFGQLALPITFSKSVAGRRKTFGQIAVPIGFTAFVNGQVIVGPKTLYGQLAMPLVFSKQVAGRRKTFGKTNSPFIFGSASQGLRRTFGKFDLPLEFEAMVKSGRITTHGVLDLDLLFMMNTSGYIMVKTALNDAIDVYLGDQEALAVYIGSERVWP